MVAGYAGLDGAAVPHLHRAHVRVRQVEGHPPHVVDRPVLKGGKGKII